MQTVTNNQTDKKKLLEQVSDAIRAKHYSQRTEKTYIDWIRRYILFHNKKHPREMASPKYSNSSSTSPQTAMSLPPPRTRPSAPSPSSTATSCIPNFNSQPTPSAPADPNPCPSSSPRRKLAPSSTTSADSPN